jgi:hypothetical protein
MTAITTAGAVISVSAGVPATYDSTGFAALSYTAIGEITDAGEFGRVYNLVTHNPVGNRKTVKKKGSYNDGQMTLQMARDKADAGQIILQTASTSDANFAFKVVLQSGTGATCYFQAQVMSLTTNLGTVDQIVGATCVVELTDSVIVV